MKVYVTGGIPDELEKMTAFCQAQGWHCQLTKGFGRPRGVYPVQKVLRMVRRGSKVAAVAEKIGIDRRHVYRILKQAGMS